ncbi:hypothetical protein J6J34_05095 [Pseudidiomarina sp. 1ASP75-14]|uniref:DUF4062 domain-containing protein n=1 Tax=Pseudidiomarina terrestris TaxID=2820060 RepID=UPI002655CA46|nr:DUF4062 domain-containing protein [Pseudidiomarina sp. 1ASP75-14]MDN7137587.1 hypothetical protein [Pseudidiomarina sp. 1ASP75-14]
MSDTVKNVSVFLASPGDLGEERRLANEAVDEINKQIAPHLGFNVVLKGWEDTLSGHGRPQHIINQELDVCELFIGMMWKKWGTPPSAGGSFTSGFEEEYSRSIKKYEHEKTPEMAMYFKEVDPELLNDPGDDLKKVIAFKKRMIEERKIFFQSFNQPEDLQQLVRLKIQDYLFQLKERENEDEEDERSQTKQASVKKTINEVNTGKGLFGIEGHEFLKEVLSSSDNQSELSSFDVARVRLLANTLTSSGNDEPRIGVHDANILFRNRGAATLGHKEISRLFDAGLRNIQHENIPIWHWYDLYISEVDENGLQLKSFLDEEIAIGALEAMKLIGAPLPSDGKLLNRKLFLTNWFAKKNSDDTKVAALKYLKQNGKQEDLIAIQEELDRSKSRTTRVALEAKVAIQLRYNKESALKTIFTHPFDSLDSDLLKEALQQSNLVDTELLKLGLSHKSKEIRLESLQRLVDRNSLTKDELKRLYDDKKAQVRKKAIELAIGEGEKLSKEEIKRILVKTTGRTAGLSSLLGDSMRTDEEGEACYEEVLRDQYLRMTEKELSQEVTEIQIYDGTPYVTLCERFFKKYADELRNKVDDQFSQDFEKHIKNLEAIGFGKNRIDKTRGLEGFVRRQLTRKGLDVLCRKSQACDLERVRKNIKSGFVKSSYDEVEFLRKHGEWEDIIAIASLEKDYTSQRSSLSTLSRTEDNWSECLGGAIYNIAKNRLDDVFDLEITFKVLKHIIKAAPPSKFLILTHETLLNLLNSENDKVRKYASLKIVQANNKSKLKKLLHAYMEEQDYRYYNVIYWLDFGVSVPKKTANYCAKLIFRDA